MERKKLITKMALIALTGLIISIAGFIYESVHENLVDKKIKMGKNKRIAELTEYCQKYLDETAGKIDSLTVNPQVLSQIKSDIFKNSAKTKSYLWMSNKAGDFIFGVPHPVFSRLNGIYDKNRTIIEKAGYYVDRNDFLLKVVHKHDRIESTQMDFSGPLRGIDYTGGLLLMFSSPVMNMEQEVIGDLYLRVDDYGYRDLYNSRDDIVRPVIFEAIRVLFVISAMLLWLLLPTWVYIDAKQRDVKRAFLWAILTVISYGFAFIVYLVTRPAALKSFHCPECGKELNGVKAFCPYCGLDLAGTICPQCQYALNPDWQFCPNCRFDLTRKPHDETPAETPGKGKEK